ncbi:MAG: NAD(P)/FAD-dependent oxidoreductase [Gammaproteobacteria bacterium]|nr:NAD(P)/FAD-dependent oxidoreductase [Gammaproteobacteria bacterium]
MKQADVIIIGAGAAGMMCGIEAGKRKRSVTILDHANKAGKKILMSGGGRCNFTNTSVNENHFISHNVKFCKSALSRYTPQHFIDLVNTHKIPFHEKKLGQLFCDNKSKDILNMLLEECHQANVDITLDTSIQRIEKSANEFIITSTTGDYCCESLVIATGGLSIPTMGASGFGYQIAEQFGIKVWPTRAGLVPFTLHPHDKERANPLSGISCDCDASTKDKSFNEAMLFTHRGLSGPAILQISSYWQPGDSLSLDLLPKIDLLSQLKKSKKEQPNMLLINFFNQLISKRHASLWLGNHADKTLQHFSHQALENITSQFKRWQIVPSGTEGYRTAEVTIGGVDCNQISSKTFESKDVKGLYFIGEVLDMTGWLGGYNFQWAWASGFAAGNSV